MGRSLLVIWRKPFSARARGEADFFQGVFLCFPLDVIRKASGIGRTPSRFQVGGRHEAQDGAVDAVALAGGRRTIVEDMAQVTVPVTAAHLGAP